MNTNELTSYFSIIVSNRGDNIKKKVHNVDKVENTSFTMEKPDIDKNMT